MALHFKDLCAPFDYPCKRGDKYPDPCDCGKFYLCEHPTTIIHRGCSSGTLFNHKSKICEWTDDVALTGNICNFHKPWERCPEVDPSSDIVYLKHRCSEDNPGHGVYPTLSHQDQPGQSVGNAGIVIGGVIGGLLFLALVAFFIIFIKRRDTRERQFLNELKNMSNAVHQNNNMKESNRKEPSDKKVENDSSGSKGRGQSSPVLNLKGNKNKKSGKTAHDNPGYIPFSHA